MNEIKIVGTDMETQWKNLSFFDTNPKLRTKNLVKIRFLQCSSLCAKIRQIHSAVLELKLRDWLTDRQRNYSCDGNKREGRGPLRF